MKKTFTLFLALTFLLGGLAYAQNYNGLAPKTNRLSAEKTIPPTKGAKSITEATITSLNGWINGPQILEFRMTYEQLGAEWMDGLIMVFPAGMLLNVDGTSDPLTTPNGCGGAHLNLSINGQNVLWGRDTASGCGAYTGGTFNFQVSVTNALLVGDQTIDYFVYGDGFSDEEPHFIAGSVIISEAGARDLAVKNIIVPGLITSGTTVTPRVTIENAGMNDENNWSLTLSDGGAYTSTVTNRPINAGESLQIDMDNWTPAEGEYTLTATLTMAGDGNTTNDTLTRTVLVGDFTVAFAWNALHDGGAGATGDGPINIALEIGAMSQIRNDNSDFIAAADYVGNEIYGTRYSNEGPSPLVKIDPTTGVVTHIGGGVVNITGFAYDITTETAYVMDFAGALGTIDLTTGVVTNIGGSDEYVIGLACDANGNLFAISLNDYLTSVDKTTGVHTQIGDLGVDIHYAQDICFDRDNNILYGALYAGTGGLYTINTTTGAATLIAEVVDELTGLAIPYSSEPQAVSEINTNQVSVYPNPSNGLVNVQVSEKSIVTLFDLTGRVIATYQVNRNETISFNQAAAGVYILKVESKNHVSTHKLIVQ